MQRTQRRCSDHDEIEEAEDVAMTGNEIVVMPTAEAVMDAITTMADADGPSAVTFMLLDEDCEEGGGGRRRDRRSHAGALVG